MTQKDAPQKDAVLQYCSTKKSLSLDHVKFVNPRTDKYI